MILLRQRSWDLDVDRGLRLRYCLNVYRKILYFVVQKVTALRWQDI